MDTSSGTGSSRKTVTFKLPSSDDHSSDSGDDQDVASCNVAKTASSSNIPDIQGRTGTEGNTQSSEEGQGLMTLLAAAKEIEISTQEPENDEDMTDVDSDPEGAYERLKAMRAKDKKPRRRKSGTILISGEGFNKRPTQNQSNEGQEYHRAQTDTTDTAHEQRTDFEPKPNGDFAPDKNLRSRVREDERPNYKD